MKALNTNQLKGFVLGVLGKQRISLLLALVMLVGSVFIVPMPQITKAADGLNPIPISPPPPENPKREVTVKNKLVKGNHLITSYSDGTQTARPIKPITTLSTLTTVPAKLHTFAACRNYTETQGGGINVDGTGFVIGYDSQTGFHTNSLLMYPQIRDVIPPVATINSAVIITSHYDPNGITFPIEAYEITSSWDPRTWNGPLPTLSAQPIANATWDLTSTTVANRTLDVSSQVISYFSGTSSQWGFLLRTTSQASMNFSPQYPPNLYIDYTMPDGSFSAATVSGGTWYDDSICPGLWLPRRATYIKKEGILGNSVLTTVVAATTYVPPFGNDNQSFRWVVGGEPMDVNVSCLPIKVSSQGQSNQFFNQAVNCMPPVNCQPFMTPPIVIPPDTYPWPPKPPEEWPTYDGGNGYPTLAGGGPPPPIPVTICVSFPEWVPDPPGHIPDPDPDPPIIFPPPPIGSHPSEASHNYDWADMPDQIVTFDRQNNESLEQINTSNPGWLAEFGYVGSTIRSASGGNPKSAMTTELGDAFFSSGTEPQPDPPPGQWVTKNKEMVILVQPAGEINYGDSEVIGEGCREQEAVPLEAFDIKLPIPEVTQTENVGIGNAEEAIDKMLTSGGVTSGNRNSTYLINPINGAVEHSNVDFSIPCHGSLSLEFRRSYGSKASIPFNIMGPHWATSASESLLLFEEGYLHYSCSTGETYVFTPNRIEDGQITSWASPPQLRAKVDFLIEGEQIHMKLSDDKGFITKYFDPDGTLDKITSAFGGEIVATKSNGLITRLTDTYSSRYLEFTYDQYNRLTSVIAPETRNWTYEYDVNGDMIEATNPIGGTWQYAYNTHKLTNLTNPRGYSTEFTYTADEVTAVKAPGTINPVNFEYDTDSRSARVTEPTGESTTFRYSLFGQLSGMFDDDGWWTQFKYNAEQIEDLVRMYNQNGDCNAAMLLNDNREVTKLFDAKGEKETFTYTPQGRVQTHTDREGNVTTFTWSGDGTLPLIIQDAIGRQTFFTYDQNKNLVSITAPYKDGNPAVTAFDYDTNGYINKMTNPLGKETTFVYNNCGEMTSTTNALAKTTTFTYNKMGWVTKVTGPSPDNYEINYVYDANGNITSITNPRNYTTTFEYNQRDLKTKAINALSQNTFYEYDDSGKLVKVKDHKNNETSLTYDNCGRLLKITDQNGKYTQAIYNNLGLVSGYLDENGKETHITYDELYRPTEVETPGGATTTYTYDKEGHVKTVTDPMGLVTTYDYNDIYQVTKVTDNNNNYSTIEYWPSGLVKKTTDPLNHIAQFDYNKLGLPTSVKDHENHETTTTYNDMGWPTRVTNPLSNYVEFEYNMYGLVTKAKNELAKETTFYYDANGNCTKRKTPLAREYTWTYDALDRVKKSITPLGYEYENTYDDVGNLIEMKDPLAHLEKYEYNNNYTLKKYVDQINNETGYNYDDKARLTKTTLPKGTYQEYTYDDDSNLKTVVDPLGNTATYMYNLAGALTERKLPNPSGGTTSFTYSYDTLGRRSGFTDEAGKTTGCTYNVIGLVTALSHPNGKSISSTYDTLNRLTGVSFGGGESFSFGYDALSRPTTSTDAHGTKTITYDAASRITNVEDAWGDDTSMAYDDDDRLTSATTPRGTTSFSYDNDSRPTTITLPGNDQLSNTFDNAARLTHTDLPNTVDVDYTYSNSNRLTQKTYSVPSPILIQKPMLAQKPMSLFEQIGLMASNLKIVPSNGKYPTLEDLYKAVIAQTMIISKTPTSPQSPLIPLTPLTPLSTTIASFSYTYDANYNITGRTYPSGSSTYTYDNYDRLTEASTPQGTYTYTYNSRSNRTSLHFVNTGSTVDETTTYSYTIDDRLSSYTVVNNLNQQTIRTASFTYDDAGNLTQKQIIENGQTYTTTYTYFDDNRIKTVTLPDTTVISFTYFADGTRATKTTATEWITYHYAGGLVKEVHHNKNDHQIINFTLHYQPGRIIHQPSQGTETTYYTITDSSGTIYKLLDTQGSVVASYDYDPYGLMTSNSAPTIYMPIGYAGTYNDSETGLLYASSRYYDPTTGRFTTKDTYRGELTSPISQNRYIYCHNNPITFADPSGFAPMEGTCASDSALTSQKTQSKEDMKPEAPVKPVNPQTILPEGDGKDGSERPDPFKDPFKNTRKIGEVIIGGYTFNVVVFPNGEVRIQAQDQSGKKNDQDVSAVDIQVAFNTGMAGLSGDAKKSFYGSSDADVMGSIKNVAWLFNNTWSDFKDLTDGGWIPVGRINVSIKPFYSDNTSRLKDFFQHAVEGVAIGNALGKGDKSWYGDLDISLNNGYSDIGIDRGKFFAMVGFWVSFVNEECGWNLPFNSRCFYLDDTLSLVGLANIISSMWFMEANLDVFRDSKDRSMLGKYKGDSLWERFSPFRKLFFPDLISNNSMRVQLGNVKGICLNWGLDFDTSTWSTMSLFESLGVGAIFFGNCLNMVASKWSNDSNVFTVSDVGAALYLWNPGYYWRDIMRSITDSKFYNNIKYNSWVSDRYTTEDTKQWEIFGKKVKNMKPGRPERLKAP